MPRGVKLALSLGLLLIAGTVATPAGSGTARAKITLLDTDPVVVAGRYFKPSERVKVRISLSGGRLTRSVVATRLGRFAVRFASVHAECSPFVVTVVGEDGSRATLRRINIPPACTVPIAP
jgi:hypothetical protein